MKNQPSSKTAKKTVKTPNGERKGCTASQLAARKASMAKAPKISNDELLVRFHDFHKKNSDPLSPDRKGPRKI
jgi:hypothetical protein